MAAEPDDCSGKKCCATAADIPADLAAEALGLSAEQFRWATIELQNGHARGSSLHTDTGEYEWNGHMLPWVEAARRVREAEARALEAEKLAPVQPSRTEDDGEVEP